MPPTPTAPADGGPAKMIWMKSILYPVAAITMSLLYRLIFDMTKGEWLILYWLLIIWFFQIEAIRAQRSAPRLGGTGG